jgi:hypothetical protein
MNKLEFIKGIVVNGIGAFLAVKVIILSFTQLFQYNEILGFMSLFAIPLGFILLLEKIFNGIEWLIKASDSKNKL